MRHLVSLAALFALVLTVAACDNTVRGAGRDIEDTADAVADTVD